MAFKGTVKDYIYLKVGSISSLKFTFNLKKYLKDSEEISKFNSEIRIA